MAIDTSALSRALGGTSSRDTQVVLDLAERGMLSLPPVVVAEMLSFPLLPPAVRNLVVTFDLLGIRDGYWQRAGSLRADLHRRGLKAKLADCLIAQSCIDHEVPLITYDRDFRHFVRAGLTLA